MPRGAKTEQTKALIARTALELFVAKGIAETTIRDIADRTGLAEGTMYRHYAGKDELAWSLFADNYATYAQALDAAQAGAATLERKIKAMVTHFCQSFDQDWVLFSFLLLSQHGFVKQFPATTLNPIEVVRRQIHAGLDRGDIPPQDAEVATAMVLGIVLQTAVAKIYGRVPEPLTHHAETLSVACWHALAGAAKGEAA